VLRQQRLGLLQQLGAGQHIEEVDRLEALRLPLNARLTLLRLKSGTSSVPTLIE
jgi:hypothetical protein